MSLLDALSRTLLLMRDEFGNAVPDQILIDALTGTTVALVADAENLRSHSGQSAFITAALLMARSGHRIYLLAPDVPLIGSQLPLAPGNLTSELMNVGHRLLPGICFHSGMPDRPVDIEIAIGNSRSKVSATRTLRMTATPWSGTITQAEISYPNGCIWPVGGLVAAALAATEAFKMAMQKLRHLSRNPERLDTVFGFTNELTIRVAEDTAPFCSELGEIDFISAGAITQAALYVFARIPALNGHGRVVEDDDAALSNLNRYMLLHQGMLKKPKAEEVTASFQKSGLVLTPIRGRYDQHLRQQIGPLASKVLVGVDHIPSRWEVQRSGPAWMTIGATSHWSAMASWHAGAAGCAQCLHPTDDEDNGAPIPTVAFVSFWAGLLAAVYTLRYSAGDLMPVSEQQIYITPTRAENLVLAHVPRRRGCPTCSH